ncbi:MAG: ABC transporter ATP-binding protein [Verrucomicrobia bacterium]|nr:ABC transporter ATP-binding protein [Verrucomicrobiota bacterium]MBU1734226.1 ABC transporter ATP-binding protein [Verrucomicrobiota bacterium]MBU1855764.1 ABC transporter ATP-binding protein [Verrucomicrobiota bacterium]
MKPILEIKSISKKYAIHKNQPRYRTLRDSLAACFRDRQGMQEFWALDNLSFNIFPGEKWGIIGENGAGKTTLLKILAKITPPTKGSILVRGRVASLLEVGTGFHPELTGRENIFLNGAILGLSRREILNRFDQIVDFAEIETFLDTPVKHYSTGMWARLAFSVAAHLDPDILLIDEVLSVGDADFQSKSLGKMNEVSRQGRTILFVSHNMAAVRQLCTHCVWISKGKIKLISAPDEVIDAYCSSNESNEQGFAESASFAHRRGSQDVCLQRIELRNQHGEMTGVYAIGDDLHIHLFIEPSATLKKVRIIVSIFESNGDCVCTMYDNDSGFSLRDISGPRHVSLNMADLRLCPGQYRIDVELLSEIFHYQYDAYDIIESCIVFKMVNKSAINRGLKRHWGLLYLTPEWTIHE